MPNFKVTGSFCLDIEDVESEEDAKNAAFEQLSSCLIYQPFDVAFEVKAEEIK